MPIKVTCPKCQGVLHAPDDAGGKRGKCPTCGTVLAIPAAATAEADAPDRPFADTPPRLPAPSRPAAAAKGPGDEPGRKASSFGMLPEVDPGRGSASKLPPSFGPAEPRKSADPFAKKAPRAAAASTPQSPDKEAAAYRRGRRGLGCVNAAYFLFLAAAVAMLVLPNLGRFGVKLPSRTPGYLQLPNVSAEQEIVYGAPAVLALLGLVLLVFGRSGAAGIARSSGAKGTFGLASLATLLATAGLVLYAVPTVMGLMNELTPDTLFIADEPQGYAQRGGLALAAVFFPLAEVLFLVALGRLGSGLGDARLTGRATRYYFYISAAVAVAGLTAFAVHYYPDDIRRLVAAHVEPQLQKLGDQRAYLPSVAAGVAVLSVWLIHSRFVAGGRRAIRGWLDRNG